MRIAWRFILAGVLLGCGAGSGDKNPSLGGVDTQKDEATIQAMCNQHLATVARLDAVPLLMGVGGDELPPSGEIQASNTEVSASSKAPDAHLKEKAQILQEWAAPLRNAPGHETPWGTSPSDLASRFDDIAAAAKSLARTAQKNDEHLTETARSLVVEKVNDLSPLISSANKLCFQEAATSTPNYPDPATVQAVARREMPLFRACYKRSLVRNPELKGIILTRFVILRDGSVGWAVPQNSDPSSMLSDEEVVACAMSAMRQLTFPKPQKGKVTVIYPLRFSVEPSSPAAAPKIVHASDEPFAGLPEATGPIQAPYVKSGKFPQLNAQTLAAGSPGTVSARCAIETDGKASTCTLAECPLGLNDAVMSSIQTWSFSPALLDGKPIRAVHSFRFDIKAPIVDLVGEEISEEEAKKPEDPKGLSKGVTQEIDGKFYRIVFGKDNRPQFISGKDPVYTKEALDARVEGLFIARCTIGATGQVSHCQVLKSLPYMEKAILDALHSRRYTPVRFKGKLVSIQYVFNIKLILPG